MEPAKPPIFALQFYVSSPPLACALLLNPGAPWRIPNRLRVWRAVIRPPSTNPLQPLCLFARHHPNPHAANNSPAISQAATCKDCLHVRVTATVRCFRWVRIIGLPLGQHHPRKGWHKLLPTPFAALARGFAVACSSFAPCAASATPRHVDYASTHSQPSLRLRTAGAALLSVVSFPASFSTRPRRRLCCLLPQTQCFRLPMPRKSRHRVVCAAA